MSVRESATFVGDLLHILVLGVVFVTGLTVQTAVALGGRRWDDLREAFAPSDNRAAQPTPGSRGE